MFSLILPGLGQVYNGEARRGCYFMLALFGFLLASFLLIGKAVGLWIVVFGGVAVVVGALVDAVVGALRRRDYRLKPYNRWFVYAGLIAVIPVANELLASVSDDVRIYKPFSTPNQSMCPTLIVGDNFIADMNYYAGHAPAFGEVALYWKEGVSGDRVTYVKRIVGLPGDRIAVRGHRLVRNGENIDEPYIAINTMTDALAETAEITVPAGQLFVLGDNRANSLDSRVAGLHGLVPVENLRGRAGEIYWPNDWARFGLDLQGPYDTASDVWQKARASCPAIAPTP